MELSDPLDVSINVTYVIISIWIPFRWFPFEKKQVIFQVHLPLVSFPGCINTRWFGEDSHFDDHVSKGLVQPPTRTCTLARLIFEITHPSGSFEQFISPEAGSGGIRRSQCPSCVEEIAKHCLPGNSANVTFLGWLRVPLSATASTSVLNQSCLYLLRI